MITLAVDASGTAASAAILEDDDTRAEFFVHTGRNHAEVLVPAIERVLASGRVEKDEVDLFAVTVGPGSFTGLRVGVSTVKGLAFVLRKPVVGVSALDALVLNIAQAGERRAVCPMVDAGRGEIYTALYLPSGSGTYEKTLEERTVRPGEFLSSIGETVIFLGGGSEKYRDLISDTLPDRSFFAPLRFNQVRAGAVGLVGRKQFFDGDVSDIMMLVPNYLRASYAASPD